MDETIDTLFDLEPDDIGGKTAPVATPPEEPGVQTYVAHYTSPVTESPTKGYFEFESEHRASSKKNAHDARIRMLELFGKDAVSWVIDEVKLKKKKDELCGDQIELDFREPKKPRKRRASKKWL
ncbi:hypothetical protein [Raoultibacter timonensis]|uniref:Uncharacterized protein n=1 Tax=Raoultibacter timonensis TaxID=1907662 RepID=A0ABM7WJR7_9ACTN|nr:hypothetical protein [Raoultibacter timonensis]BDE96597.1 hypothetical protein CE91St30_19300 [Raoultibacter timonensis]BDF51200.1 hypothetical protein CE91St31_19300 [Raoultibacter timonensis]